MRPVCLLGLVRPGDVNLASHCSWAYDRLRDLIKSSEAVSSWKDRGKGPRKEEKGEGRRERGRGSGKGQGGAEGGKRGTGEREREKEGRPRGGK